MAINTSWGLATVERRSTTDQVLHELRAAILGGRIKPSEQLPEAALAQAFGTGRSAIREALRQLMQEGLVVTVPNRGARVRPILPSDVTDLYMARTAIEVAAVQQAIERQDRLDLTDLRASQTRVEAAADGDREAPPSPQLIAADLDFHRAMVALAGSPRLSRAHEPLAAESQILLSWHPIYPGSDYAGDHRVLLNGIETRDPNVAARARAHLDLTLSLILEVAHRYADRLESVAGVVHNKVQTKEGSDR